VPDLLRSLLPGAGERGLSTWEAADLAELVVPAWDAFCELAAQVDLDARSRVPGWSARDVCVHLGSWPDYPSLQRLLDEARAGGITADVTANRAAPEVHFDQDGHNAAVIAAHADATRDEVLDALRQARDNAADYLGSEEASRIGTITVRSVLGPLPLSAVVSAGSYELAVHALDLASAGAPPPPPHLLTAGLSALVDVTGALAARCGIEATAGALAPEGGWVFATHGDDWLTTPLPDVPTGWAVVDGPAAALLDASAGRRGVPGLLARREMRLHHLTGLLSLAPIIEAVPGLPGATSLGGAARHLLGASRALRRIPGF
jgi:uncharacterized protein (TIGR03083 family)